MSEEPPSNFALSKWYLDCVSAEGDVLVAYVAELRWQSFALRYASVLERRANSETSVRSTMRSTPLPVLEGDELRWSAPALGARGRWTSLAPPIAETILERDDGRVEWHCHQPRARAEIEFDSTAPICGFGYAEHLTLTLAPWKMPINELWWGRFIADDAYLVWIDWRGPHEKQLVVLDGSALGRCRIGEHGVTTDGGTVRLVMDEPAVLREGALGKTALSVLPLAVQSVLPVRMLLTDERKWRARGTLEREGKRSEGWVLHEAVRWP